MAAQSLQTIKNWFKTGLKPTQAQFWDTWDSFRHKFDKVPVSEVEGIDALLDQKADEAEFAHHLTDTQAHANILVKKADLGEDGKVLTSQIPALAISKPVPVASEAEMLALIAETGDMAIRTDLNKTFVLAENGNPTVLVDWLEILAPTVTNTDQVPEGVVNLYHTGVRVLGTVLNGFSALVGGAVVATDTILQAFGKLQTQLNDLYISVVTTYKVNCQTGVSDQSDSCGAVQLSATSFKLFAINECLFHQKLYTSETAARSFPETTHNLSELPATTDGVHIFCVGKDYTGAVQYSTSTFSQDTNVVGICWIKMKRSAGVNTFLYDGNHFDNLVVKPDMASDTQLVREMFSLQSTAAVVLNANLTFGVGDCLVKGSNVDWTSGVWNNFPHRRTVAATAAVSFIQFDPSTLNNPVEPLAKTNVDFTKYYNTTTKLLTDVPGNNNAIIHALYHHSNGTFKILTSEAYYTDFDTAKAVAGRVVPFTVPLPTELYVLVGYFVAIKSCTALSDITKCIFFAKNTSGGGGGAASADATKENTDNKTDVITGNEGSSVLFPSVKGVVDWVGAQIAGRHTDTGWISLDQYINPPYAPVTSCAYRIINNKAFMTGLINANDATTNIVLNDLPAELKGQQRQVYFIIYDYTGPIKAVIDLGYGHMRLVNNTAYQLSLDQISFFLDSL